MNCVRGFLQRARVFWALNLSREYPVELPELPSASLSKMRERRIDDLKSLGMFLGPYRNLTTLTASVLFLHPECQVLNHAGGRIFHRSDVNFLQDYSDEKFRKFCRFAMEISQSGKRGGYGGSILLSHAFANHGEMQRIYKRRYGARLLKHDVKSLIWKESERVSRFIRDQQIDLPGLIGKNPRIKFLLPIRNPLDCSQSILRVGMAKFYPGIKPDVFSILDVVLGEIKWFVGYAKQFPEHFFYFYQNSVDEVTLRALERFLGITHDERWLRDSLRVYGLKKSYDHDSMLKDYFSKQVARLFESYPDVISELNHVVFES